MQRSSKDIHHHAKVIGDHAEKQTLSDHLVLRALCELLAELADNVHRLESEVQQLKHRKP